MVYICEINVKNDFNVKNWQFFYLPYQLSNYHLPRKKGRYRFDAPNCYQKKKEIRKKNWNKNKYNVTFLPMLLKVIN